MSRERLERVLALAYYFPPLGGAGVQRSLKFVRYLRELGVSSTVVTAPADLEGRWTPRDPSLAGELPADTPVLRVPRDRDEPAPSRWQRLLQPASDFQRWWVDGAIEAGAKAAGERRHDVIYASLAPYETADAAAALSRRLGIPWVADLRDPWALDEVRGYPSAWHRAQDLRRMGRVLAGAAAVLMNTPEATRAFQAAFPELTGPEIATLTNGFDAEDFSVAPMPHTGRFRIVHTGYLHTERGRARPGLLRRLLGGELVSVDHLTRSHVFLLEALSRWLAEEPALAEQVELVLVGVLSDADRRAVEDSPARELVRLTGYVPHEESVAWLRSADLLFLPMHDVPAGYRPRIVPGKTYEYLGARRPILAAVPPGDAADFVRASGLGEVCRPDAPEEILAGLRRARDARARGVAPACDEAAITRFERRTLTRRLHEVLTRAACAG